VRRPRRALLFGLIAAILSGVLAGCGLSGSLLPAEREATTLPAPAGTTTGSGTGTGTRTGSGSTVPGSSGDTTTATGAGETTTTVTAGGTTPTATGATSTTTTVALPGTGKPTIAIGDENTPEQFILGQLYKVALSYQGYSTTITQNIGTPATSLAGNATLQALHDGTLDLYPAYLNQWDGSVAGMSRTFRTRRGAYAAGQLFAEEHGFELLKPTPFSDTDGIAVTTAFAKLNHLRTLRDLATTTAIVALGTPLNFVQPGGVLADVERTYSLMPFSTPQIDIGSQYAQLNAGTLEATFVQTTDWQLSGRQYRVLRDPKHVFGFGNVVPVTTAQVIAAEGPDFRRVIDRVDAKLNRRVIRYLNYLVSDLNEPPGDVAVRFLASIGITPLPGS
jgi:osmoprotectant transport system substrate-binding protein